MLAEQGPGPFFKRDECLWKSSSENGYFNFQCTVGVNVYVAQVFAHSFISQPAFLCKFFFRFFF